MDGKKESLWMDELVEEYEVAREERFGEEFLGLEENILQIYCNAVKDFVKSGKTNTEDAL